MTITDNEEVSIKGDLDIYIYAPRGDRDDGRGYHRATTDANTFSASYYGSEKGVKENELPYFRIYLELNRYTLDITVDNHEHWQYANDGRAKNKQHIWREFEGACEVAKPLI